MRTTVLLTILSCLLGWSASLSADAGLPLTGKPLTHATRSPAEDPVIWQDSGGTIWVAYCLKPDKQAKSLIWAVKSKDGRRWSRPQRLTRGGNDWYPALTQTRDGQYHLAWFSDRSGNADIWVCRSPDGKRWGPARQLTRHDAWDWAPSLVVDAAGRLRIAWASHRKGAMDLWTASSAGDGNWSAPARLASSTGDNEDFPFWLKTEAGLLLCWTRYRFRKGDYPWTGSYLGNPKSEIMMAIERKGRWSRPRAMTRAPKTDILPCLVAAPGGPLLLWTSSRRDPYGDIYAMRDGGKPVRVTRFDGVDYSPRGLHLGGGRFLVVWVSKPKRGQANLRFAHFDLAQLR